MKLIKAINIVFFLMLWLGISLVFGKTDPDASIGLIMTTSISTLLLCVICMVQVEKNLDKQIKKQLEKKIDDAVIDALYSHKQKVYNKLCENPDTYKIMMTDIPIRNVSGEEIGKETFGGKLDQISGKIIRNS